MAGIGADSSTYAHGFGEPPNRGGILSALRRSPLVGADLNLKRPSWLAQGGL